MRFLVIAGVLASCLALPALAQGEGGTLARIKQSGTITIGVRDASVPFSYREAGGKATGYSVELCERVVESIRKDLKLDKLAIRYRKVESENRIQMVRSGQVDIECGSTTNTLTRRRQVDFSLPIFVDGAALLGRAEAKIAVPSDVEGKRVAVLAESSNEKALQAAMAQRQVKFTLVHVKDHDEGIARLEKGEIDAYCTDRTILFDLALRAKDPTRFALVDQFLSYEPYGIMMRRNDPDFRLAVDRALAALYRSGDIGAIFERWFGKTAPSGLLQAMFILNAYPE